MHVDQSGPLGIAQQSKQRRCRRAASLQAVNNQGAAVQCAFAVQPRGFLKIRID